jgi:Cys-rich protein (TIGR01571 family)
MHQIATGKPFCNAACCASSVATALTVTPYPCVDLFCTWGPFNLPFCALGALCFWGPQRTAVREKFGIQGSKAMDCATTFFCGPCATCQESRELRARGVFLNAQFEGMMPPTAMNMMYNAP